MNSVDLEKLLEVVIAEQQYWIDGHQKRVAFYSSLISAVFAATVAGALKADCSLEYLLLLIGPILVFSLAIIGRDGTFRFYQQVLEAITMRAKLEQALGLTNECFLQKNASGYWQNESLIAHRHIESRKSATSSKEFVEKSVSEGYQKSTRRLFLVFQVIAALIAVVLVVAAIRA